ncbi:hypothetical protein [Kitasatospora sp. NPDC057015]|uniref:hypothetical protein n=1 Tax=Kitasatospora sp. NPDC057015 TaxID=3346001 RepID=UPI00363FA606
MSRLAVVCADARIRLYRVLPRPLRWAPGALLGALVWWLLLTRGLGGDSAVLGLLAAGGWGLGLLPIHADPRSTGPLRRSGESPAPPEGSAAVAD